MPDRLPTPARQLPLTCLTGCPLCAQPFVESQHAKYGEEFTENLNDWVTTVDGKARAKSSILQRFVQFWHDTGKFKKGDMDQLLRWAQAELLRQVSYPPASRQPHDAACRT